MRYSRILALSLLIGFSPDLFSQEQIPDSSASLDQILVKGYASRASALELPAAVTKLGYRDLQRSTGVSLVPVVSTIPGVRMEERSPGSYRLSIRGSLLRSPFGVRNIKTYLDDFILTDAGGNTYLNLLDLQSVGSVEIIRGPASSIYGTGTGGVVQLGGPRMPHMEDAGWLVEGQLAAGSFGQFSQSFRLQHQGKWSWQFNQGHLQNEGYRENSRLRRDVLQFHTSKRTSVNNEISALLFFSALNYRTPGGLTLAQAEADPRQARPATPATPGAAEQQAGVRNHSLLAGLADNWAFAPSWSWRNSVTTMYTNFENPFITNYETRQEWNIGLRSVLRYAPDNRPLEWLLGVEWQRGFYRIDSTGNQGGQPTGPKVEDRVGARQQFAFTQFVWHPGKRFRLEAGVSLNDFNYSLERTIGNPQQGKIPVEFNLIPAPRIAMSFAAIPELNIYASVSRGFSPPSIAEVRPSAGGFDTDLQAEYGWNYEAGVKASAWRKRLRAELTLFHFDLMDAIVRRTDASGAEFFINAGGTRQQGLEGFAEAFLLPAARKNWLSQIRLWTSVTLSRFRFSDYVQGASDYSGNQLTGVPSTGIVSGLDLRLMDRLSVLTTFQYTDPIPLNDGNTVFADAWRLWTVRAEWQDKFRNGRWTLFAGIDNIGNAFYSLGNDLNAFGQRFYNPAPTLNWFGGINIRWFRQRSRDLSRRG